MKSYLRELKNIFCFSLFESPCRLCGSELVYPGETMICGDCNEKILPLYDPLCEWCGRPLGYDSVNCGECLVNPPVYRQHASYGAYRDELKELVLKFKYGNREGLKLLLAGYYYEVWNARVDKCAASCDFIVPVPPDKGRKREYNHILELARRLTKLTGIPLLSGCLQKIKKTPPQARLSRSRRLVNLDGAFKINRRSPSLKGKTVLLIDDVYTTGTTIRQCSVLLRKEGAEIVALTLARSI